MKKIITKLILLVTLCSLLAFPASAAGNGSLSMTSAGGNRGDTVTLNVNLNSNPGLVTMTIRVSYDTSVLQLTSVSNSGLLVGAQLNSSYGSPYTISWVDGATTKNNTKTGTIATFTFKILDSAKIGDSNVTLQFIDSYDTEYNANSFSAASGKVTVKCNHTYGSWNNADNSQHTRTCTTCYARESANHTWNSGTMTNQPSCKKEGTKIYMCTACNATKTETLPKTTDHNYGSWSKVNDSTHKHTCTICAKEETANHTWNSGIITKQPTCKEEGVWTFTCTGCGATKTETMPKATTHSYGSWTKVNNDTHKRTCTLCSKAETASHSWNSGSITKRPTCKEEGVKTFTCSGCNGTKTETIAKTNNHNFGRWTKVDETNHKHTCTLCNKEETASHTWNSGNVTKQPTCKSEGTKTFTCTTCNATKTTSIPKLTTHTYDHSCDADCNVCGATRITSHSYKTSWNSNKTEHWHECSICKAKKDSSAHTPGSAATETKAQTCTTCGYVIAPALGHEHDFADGWTTDETGHWHTCSGCAETNGYALHEFENSCDRDCAVCGFTRETTHTFTEDWLSDSNNHWHTCTGCGLIQDESAHEPGMEATDTTAQVCTICDYEITPALGVEETSIPTEESQATDNTPNAEQDGSNNAFVWIITIILIAAAGGITTVTVIKKKKT